MATMTRSVSSAKREPRRAGSDERTRARLLRAALRAFAERGFRGTTVREICRTAQANVAAVNYHFRSKDDLYLESLREALRNCAVNEKDFPLGGPPTSDRREARKRLRAFIRGFADMLSGSQDLHTRLIQRELLEPTGALEAVVREFMAPRFRALKSVLAVFLPRADDHALTLHGMSVVGQIIYYRCAMPVALSLLGEKSFGPSLVESVCRHVTDFTERALSLPPGGRGRA